MPVTKLVQNLMVNFTHGTLGTLSKKQSGEYPFGYLNRSEI